MQRIGRMGDGGKWVCGITRLPSSSLTSSSTYSSAENCTIYSFGVRDESSFEEEILKSTGCRIWAYDPAVSSVRQPYLFAELTCNYFGVVRASIVGILHSTE